MLSNKTHFEARNEWLARPPSDSMIARLLKIPLINVIVHHTGTNKCSKRFECMKQMRDIQDSDINNGFGDIRYNFVVGGDGYIYIGRNWEYEGNHTNKFNNCSIGIGLIGNFSSQDEPTEKQMNSLKSLLNEGVNIGKLRADYKLLAGNTLIGGDSPGKNIIKIIKTWPQYSTSEIICKNRENVSNTTGEIKTQASGNTICLRNM